MEVLNSKVNISRIMTGTTVIEIANETLEELREIGSDYNKVIIDLIHEHNCNKRLEAGEKFIEEHLDEFVNVHDL